MNSLGQAQRIESTDAAGARERLLAGLPVTQRLQQLAGVSTPVLEGGEGPPVVLLHGPGGNATHWMHVIADLVRTHHVIAPDLPGQGASELGTTPLDADRVLAWLGELIERNCSAPPALVGAALGGAIAARFAIEHGDRLDRVILIDSLGFCPFQPAPDFGSALHAFLAQPDDASHDHLWEYCAHDLAVVRRGLGERWPDFKAYNVDRAQTPSVQAALGALMEQFGIPEIPAADLARIAVPTALIWGRHDLATPLPVAQAAGARYGWPLHVIDDAADDPAVEQPEATMRVLRSALTSGGR
ncbi:alpha/beta hydrolase [Variovorax sp. WS11]|uniref:alpha/beta fold hydrolase n=1 Tax=Variovorax sp. WS11 TaxID=1105204 RepID=UPI000D0D8A77|nr:alpha/beta fold hydrolase [Variovorax sp. WS11]NDZ18034.1 alpha/beta fold hydrolase [Variovorax sp. WS11]PSL80085.1 alpha/beta hydrolase [Variovorax sp. WS11]